MGTGQRAGAAVTGSGPRVSAVPAAPSKGSARPSVSAANISHSALSAEAAGSASAADAAVQAAAELAMRRARASLVMDHPFFGSLALKLELKADSGCHDMWTDGRTLSYNPLYVSMLPPDRLVGAQAHEMLHLACEHHVRRGRRDVRLWNMDGDHAINHVLLDSGFALPDGFLHDPEYAGESADAIYTSLAALQENRVNEGAGADLQEGHSENGTGNDADGPLNRSEGTIPSQSKPSGEGEPEGRPMDARASRPTEGDAEGEKGQEGKVVFHGEVRDLPVEGGLENEMARRKAEREADVMLEQAAQHARNMGGVPAGILRLFGKKLSPVLDWRALLQRFLENCADADYSWSIPNRRYISQGIYLPARRELRLPHVVLAVDSSGSVDEAMLSLFCEELVAVLDAYDTVLTVLFHDTRVYEGPVVTRADLPWLHLHPVGGGGTDFRPVPVHIEEKELNPTCLLWFTDLECTRFPEEPRYPVLWICGGRGGEMPPFGEVIHLQDEMV